MPEHATTCTIRVGSEQDGDEDELIDLTRRLRRELLRLDFVERAEFPAADPLLVCLPHRGDSLRTAGLLQRSNRITEMQEKLSCVH